MHAVESDIPFHGGLGALVLLTAEMPVAARKGARVARAKQQGINA